MSEFSLFLLCIVITYLLGVGLFGRRGRILQLPFLAGLVMVGWFLPQAFGWLRNESQLPEGGYVLTMVYASGCLIALVVGSKWAEKTRVPSSSANYNPQKLLWGAALLSLIGAVAYSQIFRVEVTLTEAGYTTGIVTVLFFFAKLQFFGLAIALLVTLRRFSWLGLAIILFDLNTIVGFIAFGGRRGPAVEMALMVLCCLWFSRSVLPPRTLVLFGALAAALFINSAGDYRGMVHTQQRLLTLDELLSINFLGNLADIVDQGSHEVHNAIMYIAAAAETFDYDFGATYWNFLVFSYVPGQFIGPELKAALMFNLPDLATETFGHDRIPGTTYTGFADSFVSFSFVGVLVFAAMGYLLARWWKLGNAGSFKYQLWYSIYIATALHGITHSTQWVLAFLVQLLIFTVPLLRWATPRPRSAGSHALQSAPPTYLSQRR